MKKIYMSILFLFISLFVNASDIFPIGSINTKGNVSDFILKDGQIIVGTDNGFVEIFDLNSHEKVKEFIFEKIKDFTGEYMTPKIFSVDKLYNENTYIIITQASDGFRELYIVENSNLKKIISHEEKFLIKKAKFISKNEILLGLLSNEFILYDINTKAVKYRFQVDISRLSDFVLSDDLSIAATTNESGEVVVIDTKNGKIIKTYSGGNVDNVYQVCFGEKYILTAGQDRRAILYNQQSAEVITRFDAPFLLYACALSNNEKLIALAWDENGNIAIFDKDKNHLFTLKSHESMINNMIFIDDKNLISSADEPKILFWRLP